MEEQCPSIVLSRNDGGEPREIFIIDRNEEEKDRVFCSPLLSLSRSPARSLARSLDSIFALVERMNI